MKQNTLQDVLLFINFSVPCIPNVNSRFQVMSFCIYALESSLACHFLVYIQTAVKCFTE